MANAPLTDEELAEWEARGGYALGKKNTLRLIAALRASRERIEVLEAELAEEKFYHYG